MKKIIHNQKQYILFIATLFSAIVLAFFVWSTFIPSKREISFSGTALEYAADDPDYLEERPFTWRGSYTRSRLSGGRFEGTLKINGVLEPDQGETVRIDFSDGRGEPFFQGSYDHLRSTPANLVVTSETERYAVISLYSEYAPESDTVTASFRLQDCRFLCIGDISRAEALDILAAIYS